MNAGPMGGPGSAPIARAPKPRTESGPKLLARWIDEQKANWRPMRWTVKGFAELVGVSRMTIGACRRGEQKPTEEHAIKSTRRRCAEIGRNQRITTGELASDAEHRASYACLWDEINGDKALWTTNPFVWVVEFKRVERQLAEVA